MGEAVILPENKTEDARKHYKTSAQLCSVGSVSTRRVSVFSSFLLHSNEQAAFPYSFKFLN